MQQEDKLKQHGMASGDVEVCTTCQSVMSQPDWDLPSRDIQRIEVTCLPIVSLVDDVEQLLRLGRECRAVRNSQPPDQMFQNGTPLIALIGTFQAARNAQRRTTCQVIIAFRKGLRVISQNLFEDVS